MEQPSNNGYNPEPAQETEKNNGLLAFEAVGRYLEEDHWYPERVKDKYFYRTFYSGTNGDVRCLAQILIEEEELLFYAIAPVKAPEEMRPAVAEFLTRANYGLRIGNFELNYTDGKIRYKASVDFQHETLTPGLIHNVIYAAVGAMDRYLPGLFSLLYGGKTPVEAIEMVEGKKS